MSSLIEASKHHMALNGIPIDGVLNTDGRIHRYSSDSKRGKADEWYIGYNGLHNDGSEYLVVIYGSWSTGEKFTFKSWDENKIDTEEIIRLHYEFKEKSQAAEVLIEKRNADAAVIANKIWNESETECSDIRAMIYPNLKDIRPVGCRYQLIGDTYRLVIPLRNKNMQIESLQFIYEENGRIIKRFLMDGKKKGNFCILGEWQDVNPMYVCEGWATGVSIFMYTGRTVVIAFDAGNIYPVIESLNSMRKRRPIIIAADCDEVGLSKAMEISRRTYIPVVFPKFESYHKDDESGKGLSFTDFNDYARVYKKSPNKYDIIRAALDAYP